MKFFSNLPSTNSTPTPIPAQTRTTPSEELSSIQLANHTSLGTLVDEIARNMNSFDSQLQNLQIMLGMDVVTGAIQIQIINNFPKKPAGQYQKYIPVAIKSAKDYEGLQRRAFEGCKKTVKRVKQAKIMVRQGFARILQSNPLQMTYHYLSQIIQEPAEPELFIKSRSLSEDTNASMEIIDEQNVALLKISQQTKQIFFPSCLFEVD